MNGSELLSVSPLFERREDRLAVATVEVARNRRPEDTRREVTGLRARDPVLVGDDGTMLERTAPPPPRWCLSISWSKMVRRERGVMDLVRRRDVVLGLLICRACDAPTDRDLIARGDDVGDNDSSSTARNAINSCWSIQKSPLVSTRSKSRQIVASDTTLLICSPIPRDPSFPGPRSARDHSSILNTPSRSRSNAANSLRVE